jgi:hypothetical protein
VVMHCAARFHRRTYEALCTCDGGIVLLPCLLALLRFVRVHHTVSTTRALPWRFLCTNQPPTNRLLHRRLQAVLKSLLSWISYYFWLLEKIKTILTWMFAGRVGVHP